MSGGKWAVLALLCGMALTAACGGAEETQGLLETPIAELEALALEDRPLRAIATTSIVAEVVQQVGGELITLQTLLPPGSDPHSWTATPQDMTALQDADAIFVNGLGLEAALLPTLSSAVRDRDLSLIAVNEGVTTLAAGDTHKDEEHAGENGADPHTWQNPRNVIVWSDNIGRALSALDPSNAESYTAAAAAYVAELEALDAEVRTLLAPIPPERRKLLTDHDAFTYLAKAYDFSIIGAVVPSFSSLASVSARDLAALQEQAQLEGARALFVGNTISPALAEQMAADVGLPVVHLFSDSLSLPGESGDTYTGMMRANAAAILAALR